MSGTISDLPVRICWKCGVLSIEDWKMYEDTDRCPHCGRILEAMELIENDAFAWIGRGTSSYRQIIYTQTAGPLLQANGEWLVTSQSFSREARPDII